jgi:hypothetical protein
VSGDLVSGGLVSWSMFRVKHCASRGRTQVPETHEPNIVFVSPGARIT